MADLIRVWLLPDVGGRVAIQANTRPFDDPRWEECIAIPRADYEALLRERDEVVRRCPLCRAELDPDEMDPAYTGGMTELRPAGAGVCSECYGRWHDAPVYAKRAKDATARAERAEAELARLKAERSS